MPIKRDRRNEVGEDLESLVKAQSALNSCKAQPKRLALPQNDPDVDIRRAEIALRRVQYSWNYAGDAIPPCVPNIPVGEIDNATSRRKTAITFDALGLKTSLTAGRVIDSILDLFRKEDPFKNYSDLFMVTDRSPLGSASVPKIADRWRSDDCFAFQRLNGMNPTLVRKLTTGVPSNLTDAMVKGVLPEGETLLSLYKAGNLYVCDFEDLTKVVGNPPDRCLQKPFAYFFVDSRKSKFLPLAIQLERSPNARVFTPKDPPGVWLAAKLHVQCADANLHEVCAHLGATHLVMEAVYVSMRRHLSASHPLSALLVPHFFYTIHINDNARKKLINETGAVPSVMAVGYNGQNSLLASFIQSWDFKRYDIPLSIKRRGLENVPENYWRDDALRLWKIILEYTTGLVTAFYPNQQSLEDDTELAAWMNELTADRKTNQGCGFVGIPLSKTKKNTFACKEDLALFLCMVIFNVSAGHAAVNNGQFDHMGYVPNMPGTFRLDPTKDMPTSESGDDLDDAALAGKLPSVNHDAIIQIAMVKVLSAETDDPLGSYEDGFLNGFGWQELTTAIVGTFRRQLAELAVKIQERNSELLKNNNVPYTYLDPTQIAQGISI
eukprot:PhM_4_TR16389/c0_g1_i1/m.32327